MHKLTFKCLPLFLALATFILAPELIAQPQFEYDFDVPYGDNKAVGKFATVNGIQIYYEEYGEGEPMFLIHGNGDYSRGMSHQIDYFQHQFRVIVADSRGHGKSGLGTDSLTYVQMADDWAALADLLKIDSLYVIGWSDGGIIGLLMGIHHPEKVKKLAIMGANLAPDSSAVQPWAVDWVKTTMAECQAMLRKKDTSRDWGLLKQHLILLGDQPSIPIAELGHIAAPVLVMAGDKDIIRLEHTVSIFQHLPKAHLCIFPGETHFTPANDPQLFNATVMRFIAEPYMRPDSKW